MSVMVQSGRRAEQAWKAHGPLRDGEQLYFLHIPKTAGTTLRTFLESRFLVDEICPHLKLNAMLPHSAAELSRYRLFCGHHGLYIRNLLRTEPVMMTVLRDPLQRTISHFRHLQGNKADWLHEKVKSMTFSEFVMSDDGVAELLNFQTRYLVFEDIRDDYFGHSALRQSSMRELRGKYTAHSLAGEAKALLDRMAFVGIQEQFGDLLWLLSYTFGWPAAKHFPSFNASKVAFDAEQLTDEVTARVRELTEIDQDVYEHAAELFRSRLASVSEADATEAYHATMRARPRQSHVSFGFEKPVFGTNWLVRECPDGRWRRWSGPTTTTTLDLPLVSDRALTLRFLVGARTFDVLDSLRLFVNDVEVGMRWWGLQDPPKAQRTYEAVLPPEVLQVNPSYTEIRFEVARTIVPAQEWPRETDTRSLALYFFWLEVFPKQN